MESSTVFLERQRCRLPWLRWVFVFSLLVGQGISWLMAQRLDGMPTRDRLILGLFAGMAVPLWMAAWRLETSVDGNGVRLRIRGTASVIHEIPFPQIARAVAADQARLVMATLGCRGLGDRGVEVYLSDGGSFWIQSRRPDELAAAIESGREVES